MKNNIELSTLPSDIKNDFFVVNSPLSDMVVRSKVLTVAATVFISLSPASVPQTEFSTFPKNTVKELSNYYASASSHIKPVTELRYKIVSFGDLNENWDGYGGVVPGKQTIQDALDFASKLDTQNLLFSNNLPYIGPSGDGEISFIWRNGDNLLDVGIEGDGYYSFYGKLKNQEYFCDEARIAEILDPDLVLCIKSLS